MNICYKIFHIEGMGESANIRSDLYKKSKEYLSMYFNELDTPTIKISNQEEYEDFNKNYIDMKPASAFKYGEMGIWASNLLALKNFINTEYDYLILMEDDIQIEQYFTEYLGKYMSQLPENWDVFSYFVHPNQFSRFQGDINSTSVVDAYQDWSMLCWIVNKRSAKKILNNIKIEGVTDPIDWHIFRNKDKYNSYTLSPYTIRPVTLYDTQSTFQHLDERIVI
jgi:GR25 family glycosyltransferase involved in LPS biosynthesis